MELKVERGRDVGVRILLEGRVELAADGFPSRFVGAEICRSHAARAAAGGNNEAPALGGDLGGPFGQQAGQTARVLVVASHVNSGLGALRILGLLCRGDGSAAAADAGQQVRGVVAALDAGGAEENDSVLDLLPAKTRERLRVLGKQGQNSAVRIP